MYKLIMWNCEYCWKEQRNMHFKSIAKTGIATEQEAKDLVKEYNKKSMQTVFDYEEDQSQKVELISKKF